MNRENQNDRHVVETDPWGILSSYSDTAGVWRTTSASTREAILRTMGVDAQSSAPGPGHVKVVSPGEPTTVDTPSDLQLEDGTTLRVEHALPPDVPLGYHRLQPLDGGEPTELIVAPGTCFLPDNLRTWGWAVQLYATRSQKSWGIGDLADLRSLAEWSSDAGAGMLLVNPLCAVAPIISIEPSPYYPSSRRYRNPIYLRIEEVPGAADAGVDLERLSAAGRALNQNPVVDRDDVYRLKQEALDLLWRHFRGDPAFDRYRQEQGVSLDEFAIYCALAEEYRAGWRHWPDEHRRPDSAGIARFRREHADRVQFHAWLQWLLDEQLRRAGAALALTQDLPIGIDPEGADGWAWQDVLALDASVGAPPDEFAAQGQNWSIPPFVPHRLRAAGYRPFVETIRAALRHAGGLRIDHVMGLFRLFWIPHGLTAAEGAYVRYPARDLLAIVALESQRAQAFIVGEDLGTVEPETRRELAARKILSYRLVWFEPGKPSGYPNLALSSISTHDLPTVAGLWTGADLAEQRALGLAPNEAGTKGIRDHLKALTGLADNAAPAAVVARTYQVLAEAPSAIVTATLDDALLVSRRPNVPGTTTERPNWSIGLPMPLEEIKEDPLTNEVGRILSGR